MTEARQHPRHVLTADQAARICAERGANLTPLRRRVFEALLKSQKPASAYDLMRALRQELGRPVTPPAAYRALAFLQEQGLVLRLGSLWALPAALRTASSSWRMGRLSRQARPIPSSSAPPIPACRSFCVKSSISGTR